MEDEELLEAIRGKVGAARAAGHERVAVLVSTGSLNPVHRQHLRQLRMAADHLARADPPTHVVAAVLSPSHDSYVRAKLGAKSALSFEARCELCVLAAEEFQQEEQQQQQQQREALPVLVWAWEGHNALFVDFPDVRDHLQHLLSPLQGCAVLYVCGYDHYERCGLARWDNVVAVPRPPYAMPEAPGEAARRKGVVVVPEGAAGAAESSSTELRRRLHSGASVDDLTFSSVAARLRQLGWVPSSHGDPDYAANSLTPQGRLEAAALGRRLRTLGVTRVLSSPAGRSLETAQPASQALGLAVERLAWLHEPNELRVPREWSGVVRPFGGRAGACVWDVPGHEVRRGPRVPTAGRWLELEPYAGLGEPLRAAWGAFEAGMDALMLEHGYQRQGDRYCIVEPAEGRRRDERVAVFGHNGTVLLALAHLLRLPPPLVFCGFTTYPSSVTTFHVDELDSEGRWATARAMGVADISHLYAEGLTPIPRGMGSEPFKQWQL
eukprot:m51a1_g2866 hypothetical protein (494) ;mRNA; f:353069-357137